MAIKSLNITTVTPYKSKYDPDRANENATVFLLGTLDSRTSGRIKDLATRFVVDPHAADEEVETSIQAAEVNFQTVQYGLRGWEHFRDGEGNDIPFKTVSRRHGGASYPIVDPELMKLIPAAVIEELAIEISKANELSEVAAKK